MKKTAILSVLSALVLFVTISSCKKDAGASDPGNLPRVTFLTGTSSIAGKAYVSRDTSLYDQDSMVVGIKAWKAETPDVLKRFTITRSESGSADVIVLDSIIPQTTGAQDTFNLVFVNLVPSPVGSATTRYQTWTFAVVNRDGLIGKKSIKLQTL